ncbi:MAG: hypothetical protein DRR16_11150 [Candidatus Parabeggiatoa sp. nov. 3]|nr:MAG: hypothetical protein DRR00_19290 [Gammaproteobacteria bacterium]RKZ68195.1 MAG: hypothetical protein DRQ99_04495 [Gammaproteobacteria bacterium]RKZ85848.1 MAG: hypothetical protein DRR16_11150 [Gammaproteobacteria bacterium]
MIIAENEAEEYQYAEQKKQVYLSRVNQLFGNIQNWLKDEARVDQQEIEVTEKFTGTYTAPALSISTQTGEKLVDIKPRGVYIILAEGMIDVEGEFGRERITYMVDGGPDGCKANPQNPAKILTEKMFKEIDDDGWYWIEETLEDKVHFVNNKNALLEIITQVSE